MRIRRNRLNTFYLKKRISNKDKEGCSSESWDKAVPFVGEKWPASGKVQAEQYGDRLNYILNLKLDGGYQIIEKQGSSFDFGNGLVFKEQDGICIFVSSESVPDYKIISIKPYRRQLKMELEKI